MITIAESFAQLYTCDISTPVQVYPKTHTGHANIEIHAQYCKSTNFPTGLLAKIKSGENLGMGKLAEISRSTV